MREVLPENWLTFIENIYPRVATFTISGTSSVWPRFHSTERKLERVFIYHILTLHIYTPDAIQDSPMTSYWCSISSSAAGGIRARESEKKECGSFCLQFRLFDASGMIFDRFKEFQIPIWLLFTRACMTHCHSLRKWSRSFFFSAGENWLWLFFLSRMTNHQRSRIVSWKIREHLHFKHLRPRNRCRRRMNLTRNLQNWW